MKRALHRAITERAVGECFDSQALMEIVAANLGQDALYYQVGHAHFHYDENAFEASDRYVSLQHHALEKALERGKAVDARRAFGRLSHAVQDFYAHSNYVALWLARFSGTPPAPEAMEILDREVLSSPALRSGKIYYPLEALTFIGPLTRIVTPLLPRDSHAWMNIDGPQRPLFDYAFAAAVKRTRHEFENAVSGLSADSRAQFTGRKPDSLRRL